MFFVLLTMALPTGRSRRGWLPRAKVVMARSPALYRAARRSRALGLYLLRRPHEPDFAAFALFPDRRGLFLDVGANLGNSALSFRMFNRYSPILSIEPNPFHERDLRMLKRILNGFDYAIFAAGEATGELTLRVPIYKGLPLSGEATVLEQVGTPWWVLEQGADPAAVETKTVRVPVRRLDDLALDPDFVKIDVEGAEESVIRGLSETIERSRPILLMERSSNAEAIAQLLERHGYSPYIFLPERNRLEPYAGEQVTNLFFLPDPPEL